MKIAFTLNSKNVTLETDGKRRLVDVIREDFGLTATKSGCLAGHCGGCLVILEDELIPACMIPVLLVQEKSVITIEGIALTRSYNTIIDGFTEAGYFPCSFCLSSKILTTYKLLESNPNPGERGIREAFAGNICRCTGTSTLIEGVLNAATRVHRKRRARNR